MRNRLIALLLMSSPAILPPLAAYAAGEVAHRVVERIHAAEGR